MIPRPSARSRRIAVAMQRHPLTHQRRQRGPFSIADRSSASARTPQRRTHAASSFAPRNGAPPLGPNRQRRDRVAVGMKGPGQGRSGRHVGNGSEADITASVRALRGKEASAPRRACFPTQSRRPALDPPETRTRCGRCEVPAAEELERELPRSSNKYRYRLCFWRLIAREAQQSTLPARHEQTAEMKYAQSSGGEQNQALHTIRAHVTAMKN